jgi:hypothetical protein
MKFLSSVHCDTSGTLAGIKSAVDATIADGANSLMVLLCSRFEFELTQLAELFACLPVTAIGGVVPGIIEGGAHHHRGALVMGFNEHIFATVIRDIDRPGAEIAEELTQWLGGRLPAGVAVVIDSRSPGVDSFVSTLYDRLGPRPTVIGAGMGYLDFSTAPCLITASGLFNNAAMVFGLQAPLVSGVSHGWTSFAGPFLVTESQGNLIHSINYQPAFSFYRNVLQEQLQQEIDFGDFFAVAKSYPFGMAQLDNEFLVRDPFRRDGESIECAGSIPRNTMINILRADPAQLIESSARSARSLRPRLHGEFEHNANYHIFIIDCISKELYLDREYPQSLAAIRAELPNHTPTSGVLSFGEIASSSQGVIHFLNKTTVITGIGE